MRSWRRAVPVLVAIVSLQFLCCGASREADCLVTELFRTVSLLSAELEAVSQDNSALHEELEGVKSDLHSVEQERDGFRNDVVKLTEEMTTLNRSLVELFEELQQEVVVVNGTPIFQSRADLDRVVNVLPYVRLDCQVSPWSKWSQCSKSCGGGTKTRTRYVVAQAQNGGNDCPNLDEMQSCNTDWCVGCTNGCTTYIRWGSTTCRDGARLLYTGVAASSKDDESGSGYNRLCMSLRADFGSAHDDTAQSSGRLWGAEYQTSGYGVGDLVEENNRPITCAVCEVSVPDTIMIPASVDCPSDWIMEYNGYLMANHYSHYKGEYVCVDQKPKRSILGNVDTNNNRWYPTEIECGGLPCPPYTADRELSCVVCSPPSNISGSFYIRWGRTSCPNDTELVYSGHAAASKHDEAGNGANNLCLHGNPSYLEHYDANHDSARIYGIHYYTSGYGVTSLWPLHTFNAPCAVCLIPRKDANIMVPGSNLCPMNWNVEYKGYLMSNVHNSKKLNFVCVDEQPESLGVSSSSQGRWYPTQTMCGRISCQAGETGSYYNYWELACAVCSPDISRRSSVFTHWGSNSCPNETTTVYTGFMGGSHSGHLGSGANLLCMRGQAAYGDHETNSQGSAYLYGYEYETNFWGLHGQAYTSVHNKQIPCAVCETVRASTTVSLFGQWDCPTGFEATYRGYTFSARYNQQKAQYVCIDEVPDVYPGSSSNDFNEGKLYPVEAQCGSLPCPPYTNNREVVCVQCTTAVSTCDGLQYNGMCVRECPLLTYADNSSCYHCHPECAEGCHGPSSTECYRCSGVFVKATRECVNTCPDDTIRTTDNVCVDEADLLDCEGVQGGNKTLDVCGVCDGDGTTCRKNAVYVRWGREDCPDGTRRLLWGIAASSASPQSGSGYNRLCLPSSPSSENQHSDGNEDGALLYGSTYKTAGAGVTRMQSVDNGAVPCAMCEAQRGGVIMIPGTNVCPNGWKAEYSGYVMANLHNSYRGEYVCVDGDAQSSSFGNPGHTASYWYVTEYYCGNLECPWMYTQSREITCVVCSPEKKVGGVYVQWGRTECTANGTYGDVETLYSGQSAGAHHSESGSGANPLCLVHGDLIRHGDYDDSGNTGSRLYGAQYETSGYGIASAAVTKVHGHLIPCSVCFTPQRDSQIIVSGQNSCPDDQSGGWRLEYSGFLFAGYYSHQKSNWVCVDREPESLGFPRSNQARWYPTEIECGSIECQRQTGGYVANREVTCAVCSPTTKRQGAVFTRWGKGTCPQDVSLVYSGFAAGSLHSHSGSGANVLCLTQTTKYAEHNDQDHNGALLYGYEYQTSGFGLRSPYPAVNGHEVPCAVCDNPKATTTVTLFARSDCPDGYKRDYWGYVFGPDHSGQHKGEFICVDSSPETYIFGSSSSTAQARVTPSEVQCGAIPCPPYELDRELVCAQCSLEGSCMLFRHLSECLEECPALTYAHTDRTCLSCHQLCAEGCVGPGPNECVGRCLYVRFDGVCLPSSNCPDGTVADRSGECVQFQVGMDCEGVMNGTKEVDACGVCDGDSSTCRQSAVYVRWGRKDCPSGSKLLFEGFTAGSDNGHSGSGYNHMCMPLKPSFGADVHQDNNDNGALIYGVEYETSSWSGSPWDSVRDATVPCAVCEARLGSTFMLSGNDTCPQGFKSEYEGFIMANFYNQWAGEYICVDKNPVKGTGSINHNNGRIYPTEFVCGNLPCGQYPTGHEVACVVCSPEGPLSGSSYVRWGRADCPSSSQFVYSGRAAGSEHNQHGSGANPLCVIDLPSFPYLQPGTQGGGRLRGFRYVTNGYGIQSLVASNNFAVPCAVCFTPERESNFMQPGRDDCPVDWEVQYSGYLFGSHYSHRKTNFICIDKAAQSLESVSNDVNIYPTEVECGSIRCHSRGPSGYQQDSEVTCSVCTPATVRKSATYTHWGRSDCPANSRVVYTGFAAGSHHAQTGSGANSLCLPNTAKYDEYNTGNQGGCLLYGFEFDRRGLFGNFASVEQREVPCAVCENSRVTATFTLFGNTTCPRGFTVEYTGYIFSTYHTSGWYKNEFVCVDDNPGYYDNDLGTNNNNQAQMVPSEFEACGQFPCPPWVQDREVACAQCSDIGLNVLWHPVDCVVSQWADFSVCTSVCGGGSQNRSRDVLTAAANGGRSCPSLFDLRPCNTHPCSNGTYANSTYVRWGRYSCNSPAELVFSGYTAGKEKGHSGSGFNYICLPDVPGTGTEHNDGNHDGGLVYAVNYNSYGYIGNSNLSVISGYVVPCALCEAQRGDVMTLYGTTSCPIGWREEYKGYVMSAHHSNQKTQYICVDEQATWRPDRKTGSQGPLYLTETQCGSLPCPPYVTDREFACVVCSPLTRSGSVYTRWGRKSCPDGNELIHTGQAASSHYSHSGSGANTICMFDGTNATYLNYNDGNNDHSLLYGVAFQTSGYGVNSLTSVHNQRVPCSVCFVNESYSTLTLPAKTACPSGWEKQYSGYLFSAYFNHKKEDWLCVDESPESNGPYGSSQGLIYPVEIECGSIHCGSSTTEYLGNYELTCVVCASPAKRRSSLFTRWGRSQCPFGVNQVYSGFAGGSHRSHPGSGPSVLCMPQTVDYVDYTASNQNGGLLYGYEYQTSGYGPFSTAYQSVDNMEVPCVVCDSERDAATFTHYGSQECPRGYNSHYVGYVFSGRYNDASTAEYICVDDQPEGYNNSRGSTNDDQALLFAVEYECGSLPCPPFTQDREVQCAQCGFVGSNDARPIHCEISAWSTWTSCTFTCGVDGTQTRNRSILVESKYGGRECSPEIVQLRQCKAVPCPADPFRPGQSQTNNGCPTTYVRWGRTSCPPTSTILFSGYAASSNDDSSGSGFNRLCLPDKPEFGLKHYDKAATSGLLYGQEYETQTGGYGFQNFTALNNYPIPCVICEVKQGPVLQVPGTILCPSGWLTEYQGYLMANLNGEYRGEFVCVDKDPEAVHQSANNNHGRWFPTETDCGVLECVEEFRQNRELTCVVCTPSGTDSGSLYTRWGRSSCPYTAQTVYPGQAVGPRTSSSGSGANSLCLTMDPVYSDHSDVDQTVAVLGGVKYNTQGYGISSFIAVHHHRVPCAVCFTPKKMSNFMQPGNRNCPPGFHREYAGLLFAAYYNHHKHDWVCVDEDPESIGYTSSSFGLWYPTEVQCGSIECQDQDGGYQQNKEVACAVCSPDTTRMSSVYTRWGRNECPVTSQQVYNGFAAGAAHHHPGSGASVLCMTARASYGDHNSRSVDGALLYGYEYETTTGGTIQDSTFTTINNHEIPCAVCENRLATASFTQFGRDSCPHGYDKEYTGYVFSARHDHRRSSYICVDKQPDYFDNALGSNDNGQALLYPVEYRCGSLLCPPYVNSREVLCSQCSKQERCLNYAYNGSYVAECPSGTFLNITTGSCSSCHEFCGDGCNGPLDTNCVGQCKYYSWSDRCVRLCPPGFVSNSNRECVTSGHDSDCEGTFGGSKIFDRCGVCGGDGQSCNQKSVYFHWGSTSCPFPSRKLYDGYTASPLHSQPGGGYNYLCLHKKPTFGFEHSDSSQTAGEVYGVQYYTASGAIPELSGVNGATVPCAACETVRSGVFMYPGSSECPHGWHVEYEGYLMANYYDTRNNRHHKTEFICVERHAERGSGPADRNQAYVYPTEVACGDLPCPPYTGNRELSCVVCSPTESTGPGQVYVRWGKQACPSNRTTVKLYDGRTAVSDPGHWGGASNPLCLPMQPSYFQHNDKHQYATLIYGAAYETSSGPPYAEGLQAVDNGRIPCSVCFTPDIHGHVLVPGRIECPNNFISEYYGYLFSAHRACCSTNYICVDHEPETIGVESGGKMLYTVEIECGSILCQNEKTGYVGNREATCVLCVSDTKRRTAVYTAWGAIDCPGKNSSSREVFSGFVAGSPSGNFGSGNNLLCMHPQAQYLDHDDREHGYAVLYGYEYEAAGLRGEFTAVTNREIPCTVCENLLALTTFTQFGSTSCPGDFRLDYAGYVFSTRSDSNKGEFVCVSRNPKSYDNGLGNSNHDHGSLYPVESKCNALPCPPYTDDREVMCAQCTRWSTECSFFWYEDTCVLSCPDDSYANDSRVCQQCHPECAGGCLGPTESNCMSCRHYKMDKSDECVLECPADYIAVTTVCIKRTPGMDCAGVINGSSVVDRCGVCGGNDTSCNQKAVYIRWGRTSCSSTAKLLYHGISASSHDNHAGGGYNSLCLPTTPVQRWEHTEYTNAGSFIYGAEYESLGVFGLSGVNNYPVPCAVCEARRGETIMIPGTYECPSSAWIVEYAGYIMSNRHDRYKGEFVCMDQNPEKGPGNVNHNNAPWYPTEIECGTLPCPPYTHDREIACVVCSPAANASVGTVYTRWGRTNCPFDNMLVYQGRAASSQQSGSGANPLCVTATPLYLAHDDGNNGGAQLFGAQYVWNSDVAALKSVNGKRIPCAVCMIPNKGSSIMVPGENFCPFEWKIEYWGYLMASRYSSNAKSNWVCIDSQPEALDLSASGSGQVYWYATEIECGGMACSRSRPNAYVLQRELTCAVCSPTTFRRTAVYIRYGQNHCPSGSSLVRAGFVAGEHHGHGGSSASILCMTPNASYADHNDNSQDGARLYGYEYETSSNALRSQAYKSVHNHEIPCAVCENIGSSATFSLFGSDVCPVGYERDYQGYAFSSRYNYRKSEFVCVDRQPGTYDNGRGNSDDNNGRLHPVSYECGTLPCPPFTNNREVVCAQCSKVIVSCDGYWNGRECVSSCPPGKYANTTRCKLCDDQCGPDGCGGPGPDQCISCRHVNASGLCVSECPNGTVADNRLFCVNETYPMDCDGIVGGTKTRDRCGVCGGNSTSCNSKAVYTRWGRKSCPPGAKKLYDGYAASSPSGAIGSGFNRLCLPHDPGFGFPHYDSYSNGANTIGAEYETASAASAHVRSVADKPIPCAVCEAVRGSVLHVTGSTQCPERWTMQYYGYIMANYFSSYKGEYVCVDVDMEQSEARSGHNQDRWYLTEVYCEGISCPPYVSYRELGCAVCVPPQNESGTVYFHWGRKDCPSSAVALYAGQAVSSHYSNGGSGANPVCLTDNPEWSGLVTSDDRQDGARMSGARYMGGGNMLIFESKLSNKSIPCSACYVPDKEAYIMSPGSDVCPEGWQIEYKGYLFAANSEYERNDWVCVDQNAEAGTSPDSGSAYWYPTEIRCGSLPCYTSEQDSYVSTREVTCAVCTPDTKRKSSVFVRWGRPDCPSGTVNIYDGLAGGAYHTHSGSGASILCMRKNATYAERNDSDQGGALLYGVEYQAADLLSPEYTSMENRQMSCAVCEIRTVSSTFTLFGKLVCPEGYEAVYTGYGFASRHHGSSRKTSFICVDDRPEAYARRAGTDYNEGVVWPMEISCGTLACPPYTSGREVQCAQCSYRSSCPHVMDGRDCLSECPADKYVDSSMRCRLCHVDCEGCTGAGPSNCIQCRHYKHEARCVAQCPEGKVANLSNDCISPALGSDCAGVLNGSRTIDRCGVCGGNGTSCLGISVFTRWGRQDCPSGSRKLYDGYMATASHEHTGSGYNALCLANPGYAFASTDGNQDGDLLYGTTFQTSGFGVTDLLRVHNYTVACAVCEARAAATYVVHGTEICPSGWQLEYWGYLMANFYHATSSSSHFSSEYICVDNYPTTSLGTGSAQGWIYPTETECGNIPCPPYRQEREVVCSVCSSPVANLTGSVYTRWGRTSCPSGAQLLYQGYAARGHLSHSGSGANNLCLIDQPTFRSYSDSDQNGALLYGIAYESSGVSPDFNNVYHRTAPCAVCYSPSDATLLYPARSDCPADWKIEYTGYIMAEYYSSYKGNWVCVDEKPESRSGQAHTAARWYMTEIECGSIWCRGQEGRYIQDRELTCSVCIPDYPNTTYGGDSNTYVRWGRDHCPSSDDILVYSGFAAGSSSGHTGSGANVLCMPEVPVYSHYNEGNNNGALLYGYEYESSSNFLGSDMSKVNNYEVPCAVCMNRKTISTFTLYGDNVCPSDYGVDYWGFVFGNHYTANKGQHICVDHSPTGHVNPNGNADNNQGRLYPAEVEVGSLPSPPFAANREVLCSQCSKRQ